MRFSNWMAAGSALLVVLTLAPVDAFAAPGKGRMFGKGAPFEIKDLPPGRVRSKLESLPAPARERAMSWLHSFSFPEADLESIHIDPEGGVYYVDSFSSSPAQATALQADATVAQAAAAAGPVDAFRLHSRPGASKVAYLDFDGHTITGTAWNADPNIADTLVARAYDIDGDPTTFNTEERNRIAEIWHRVAEDYAPFDIDITTEEPASFGPTVARVLITTDTDVYGNAMPAKGWGGVAYGNVWGSGNFYPTYSPALVYYNYANIQLGAPNSVSELASHELGHNLSLSHDGTTTGSQYYPGSGSPNSYVSWAPIMGENGYGRHVTQWSKGEYPNANNPQDDLLELSSRLGYRPDDYPGSFGVSTPLVVDAAGKISVTMPDTDPANTNPANKGVIETSSDIDVFSFDTPGGVPVNLTVKPAWAAFYGGPTAQRGANLDVGAVITDLSGTPVISSNTTDDTQEHICATLPAGRYYLMVGGVQNQVTPYSDYASLGQYYISGGIGVVPAALSFPVSGSALKSNQVKFQWDDTCASQYWLFVGKSMGAIDIYSSGGLPAGTTSHTVSYLPTDGSMVYVRLMTQKPDGSWLWNDYTYTPPVGAAMVSPVPGSTLTSSSATFSWNSTPNPHYLLTVGTAVGASDIYFSPSPGLPAGTTSWTVSGLPTNGSTLYVRLASEQPGTYSWFDYTYKAVWIQTDTGYKYATANAADTGGDSNGFEGTPGNAYAVDGLFATDSNSGTTASTTWTDPGKDRHRYYNFGMSIPAGSTIRGLGLQLKAKANSTSGSPKIYAQISWDGGTTWTTAAKSTATLSTTNTVYTLGGSADTWGRTWTAGDFDNTKFRVRLIDVAGNTSTTFSLDSVAVRVYY